ncbi:glycoside hydrolase superfamily [Xylariaceae sp. FL1651]|nr:glycoside hydrolase superfamily [Xylariaceae sp. FL1651]
MTCRSFIVAVALLALSVFARDFPNCQSGLLAPNQVCNTTLDPWSRATALVVAFTTNEKISNSWDNSLGVSRIGLPAYECSGHFSYATSFPQPITMGAAFDIPLIASVTSTEARAFSNAGRSGPYHMAQYVMQLIPGLQGGLKADPYYKLVATCKHYAGYDIENWKSNARHVFDAKITMQDLQDYSLQPFRACVRDTRWVTADCNALEDVWTKHHYGGSAAAAAAASLNAGTDLDCGQFWPQNLPSAYSSKLFNDAAYRQLAWADVAAPDAKALALRAAQEGLVLLKNNGTGKLPLSKTAVKRIAVAAGFDVTNAQGTTLTATSTSGFTVAVDLAKSADATVYVGGIDTSIEAEGKVREQITWPGVQLSLIQQLAAATADKPFIVVQMGTMVDSSALVTASNVNALLWAGYPGQDGGTAVVSVRVGDKAPAATLPVTQYPGDYVNQGRRTYKWLSTALIFPFGHGLHYTSFNASLAGDLPTRLKAGHLMLGNDAPGNHSDLLRLASVPVLVTNTGNVTSDYVVLAFLKGEYGPTPYPNKSLVAFTRLQDIKPGDTATGTLNVTLGSVARSDEDGALTIWPAKYKLVVDIDDRVAWDFEIIGSPAVLDKLPGKK